jgi:putative hydrolase of HD superfamily
MLIERTIVQTTKRTGWVNSGVKLPESISDHMHRMSVISLLLGCCKNPDNDVDVDKCIKMSIVHDLAEAIVGDITPHCGISKDKKFEMEFDAITKMTNMVGGSDVANAKLILDLWLEYEKGEVRYRNYLLTVSPPFCRVKKPSW